MTNELIGNLAARNNQLNPRQSKMCIIHRQVLEIGNHLQILLIQTLTEHEHSLYNLN